MASFLPPLRPKLPRPRLLPLTIAAMTALLVMKSATLVQAAAKEQDDATPLVTRPGPAVGDGVGRQTSSSGSPQAPRVGATAGRDVEAPTTIPGPATVSEAERAVLLDLRRRREALDARTRDLDQREADLQAADQKLDGRVRELAALQTRLEGLESSRKQHADENWGGLVKVYEAMKPREAAAIFDVLDMQVLLQVLDRMQDRRAAPVLAAMQPDRARLATQLLAEMRTRATTPPRSAPPSPDPKG